MTNAALTDAAFSAASDKAAPMTILTPPHPVLRQKARLVKPEDMAEIQKILPGMFAAMYQAPGIGLAAPQVGLSQRFVLIDLGEKENREPMILINPEIVAETEEMATRRKAAFPSPASTPKWSAPKKCVCAGRPLMATNRSVMWTGCWPPASSTNLTTLMVFCLWTTCPPCAAT